MGRLVMVADMGGAVSRAKFEGETQQEREAPWKEKGGRPCEVEGRVQALGAKLVVVRGWVLILHGSTKTGLTASHKPRTRQDACMCACVCAGVRVRRTDVQTTPGPARSVLSS